MLDALLEIMVKQHEKDITFLQERVKTLEEKLSKVKHRQDTQYYAEEDDRDG